MVGFALHGVAFALVLFMRRERFTPLVPLGTPGEISLAVMSMALALGSIWITVAGLRVLSRQWGVAARLVEGHTLVTEGPYRLVRHPIYLGNLGILLATGLAFSRLQPLWIAILVFLIGTAIRIHAEEKLLREAFGQEFESYARRVPALFPRLH
jgi:protein-S-isoprenylcysteine O-methyltransferase Ste14